MKKIFALVFIPLLSLSLSAQIVYTEVPIEGFGQFRFGIDKEELLDGLEGYTTAKTEIVDMNDANVTIVSHIEHLGYLFDFAGFTFGDDGLTDILFSKHFSKEEPFPKEFEELLSAFENDYGKLEDKESILQTWEQKVKLNPYDKNSLSLFWTKEKGGVVLLSKNYEEDDEINILIINVTQRSLF